MASIIDANQAMFTPFEPKMQNRFVMSIDGIPAYLIKTASRPSITMSEVTLNHLNVTRYVKGKANWDAIDFTLYDPIVPSAAQAVMEWVRLHHESVTGRDGYSDFYKKDVDVEILGPVGDIVEKWKLKGAFITKADFGGLDFGSTDVTVVTVSLRFDYAILEF